jgi:NADPH:quinone reductase-like Zn-dependent oxidoreductase
MECVETEAWVLYSGADADGRERPAGALAELRLERYSFPSPGDDEVLVEPIVGCWEGNMNHALLRQPVDICRQRKEPKVVIGNAGVVRVLRAGRNVRDIREHDLCLVFCNGVWDAQGYPQKIYAYDAPQTVGLLAKRTKLHARQLIRLPRRSRHSLDQWAAFSLRFITAWANWKIAYSTWLLQRQGGESPAVWGWGGGVTLAELLLAQMEGCEAAMIASHPERLALIRRCGFQPVNRNQFPNLSFDRELYRTDETYRASYLESERLFLETVRSRTHGRGVSIFIDFIGQPVFRATLKSLARPGVITTAGWKGGMDLALIRAMECMCWHTHVHTHYARYGEGVEAVNFSEEYGWSPPVSGVRHAWELIPKLAAGYAAGDVTSFFPLYQVNPE